MSETQKAQFSLGRLIIAVLLSGLLMRLTQRIPVDYVVPESIMRERIRNGAVPLNESYYRVGAPFGGFIIKETWNVETLTKAEELVEIRYMAYVGNALFWFASVLLAFLLASWLIRRRESRKL